jgi:ribosomal protein L30
MTTIKIKQVRSRIGCPQKQKRTLDALGLRKIGRFVEHEASPAILGMVEKVKHLVSLSDAYKITHAKSSKIIKLYKIISQLKKLNLSTRPKHKIRTELDKIKQISTMIPTMLTKFSTGKEIERAVANSEEEPIFTTDKRISYKPKFLNTDYQRASTPNETVFYGSVIPEEVSSDEIPYARIIGAAETSNLIRDENASDGEQAITFGKWIVLEDLNLVTIVNPNKEYKIQYIKELVGNYRKNLNKLSDECRISYELFLEFITNEFEKKVQSGKNYEYMVSAIFTEWLMENTDKDGIIYPSVQAGGEGLCVAIKPESMHKLKLSSVLQCKVVRTGKSVSLNNLRYSSTVNSDGTFELLNIDSND